MLPNRTMKRRSTRLPKGSPSREGEAVPSRLNQVGPALWAGRGRATHTKRCVCLLLTCTLATPALAGHATVPEKPEGVDGPWPADVKGWEPVKPGDHPRILFRKADIPALRKRAKTPEGKAILERIKMTFDKHRYTTWHAAGYAFLHVITEDKQYLDEAKKMAEWTFKGRGRNPDGRYKWPGDGQLRGGPCLWGLGLAYDLGYNYWDEEFRKYMIKGIMANTHFDAIPNSPRHGPGCNHYGAHTGGAGATLHMKGSGRFVDGSVDVLSNKLSTVNGTLLFSQGFTLTPGGGTLTVKPSGTFGGTGTLDGNLDCAGTFNVGTNGVIADKITVNGTVTLSGPLEVVDALDSLPGVYVIIDNDGADTVSGTFQGISQGTVIRVGTKNYKVSYTGGDGNDVEIKFRARGTVLQVL